MSVKVVHLITGLDGGGAERMLTHLASGGDRAAFSHTVVSMMDEGVYGPELREAGVTVHCLDMPRGRPSWRGFRRFLKLLRAEQPAVLQTWLYHADLLGLAARRLSGSPRLVWNLRCSDMDMAHYSPLSRLILRLLARWSDRPDLVIVNSEAGRVLHQQLGYRPRRWSVIPNGFDLGRFHPDPAAPGRLRAALGLPADAIIAGHVARFDPMKDHAAFLAALALCPNIHGVMVGKGVTPTNLELTDTVRRLGLEARVHCLGERRDMPELMAGFDFLVLSSAFGEGFPNVVGEAMASATPCIATEVGDAAAIIGATGKTVPRRDPAALARAMNELAALTPTARHELGKAARVRIEAHFGLPQTIAAYEREYLALID